MSFAHMFQLTWNILNPSEGPPFSIYSVPQPSVCSSSCSFIWNQQKSWGWRNIRIYDHSWFNHPPPWHFTSAQLRPWLVQAPTIAATKASAVWAMHWWPCWSRRRQVEYQSYGFSGSWLDGKSQGIIGHQWIASNLATSYDTVWSCLGVVSLVRQAFLQQLPTRTTTIGDRLLI